MRKTRNSDDEKNHAIKQRDEVIYIFTPKLYNWSVPKKLDKAYM